MADTFVSGLLAGYGLAIPVGAIGVLLLHLAARSRFPVSAAAALGVATVDGCYALVAAVGGTAVAVAIRPVATPLAIAAAVVLFMIAARILLSARRGASREPLAVGEPPSESEPPSGFEPSSRFEPSLKSEPSRALDPSRTAESSRTAEPSSASRAWSTPGRAYIALIGLTAINPATITYFLALVLGHNGPSDPAANNGAAAGTAVVFASAAFAASASWQLVLAAGGNALGRFLSGRRGRLVTALVSALLITALALRTLVTV